MILYTMMPQELIFPVQEQAEQKMQLVTYQGVPLMVEKTAEMDYRVVRLVSTDPMHYLDNRFSPGTKISF